MAVDGAHLLIDTATVNAAIVNTFKLAAKNFDKKERKSKLYGSSNGGFERATAVHRSSPISIAKALKNDAEVEGMRNSHLRYFGCSSYCLNFKHTCIDSSRIHSMCRCHFTI